jgi:hypothetical protein
MKFDGLSYFRYCNVNIATTNPKKRTHLSSVLGKDHTHDDLLIPRNNECVLFRNLQCTNDI